MKILLILNELVTGGAEIFSLHLAACLQRRGHDILLLTLRGEVNSRGMADKFWPYGSFINYRSRFLFVLLKIDGLLYRLRIDHSLLRVFQIRFARRVLTWFQPDVVHSHLYSADLVAKAALGSLPITWFTTIHGDYLQIEKSFSALSSFRLFRKRCAEMDNRINSVVVLSEEQLVSMKRLFPKSSAAGKHRLIPNGLPLTIAPFSASHNVNDLRINQGLSAAGLLIGMVGRGIAEKGWDVLIRAFQIANLTNAELLLIGDGPALRQLAAVHSSPRIHFHGSSSEPQELLRLCDFTCLPSRYQSESCPLAVAESVANGVPVIATRVGQISWMLDEHTNHPAGRTLPLAPPDELSGSLASLLKEIHANPALLESWKQNCRLSREKFSIERCADDYLEAYKAAGA